MPRQANRLTAVGVRNAKPGIHVDGGGLLLVVKGDAASWVLRYTFDGRRRDMGLGPARGASALALADARGLASAARLKIREGVDPLDAKKAEKVARKQAETKRAKAAADTFKAVAEAFHGIKAPEWKNARHREQWMTEMKLHAFPVIGAKPVEALDVNDLLAVLNPIWARVPETASRMRGRMEAVINYAVGMKLRPPGANPAAWRGNLANTLGRPSMLKASKRRQQGKGDNHPSLPWQEAPAFMTAAGAEAGIGAMAMRFVILTAARTGEVAQMRWRELDLEKRIWIAPALHMKGGKVHFVPLSDEAVAILKVMEPLAVERDSLIFPSPKTSKRLAVMAFTMLLRRMSLDGLEEGAQPRWHDPEGRPVVPHGFRATFKSWSLSNGWPDHLSEKALAHADRNQVRAAYARESLVEERRPMMEAWARWCTGTAAGSVTDLAAEKAKRLASA